MELKKNLDLTELLCISVPADAGFVRTDESVIAIAGTGSAGRGADTAIVVQPANVHNFFEMRIRERLF